ncbi:hypothetical protein ACIRF8_21825 [Streptomyces sp. NPDC102406]|uniref:hypothetical protein n=1 Tax=Streptomyces sp. NPDC102406 TaxID=3366171 RepID=UPI00383024F5
MGDAARRDAGDVGREERRIRLLGRSGLACVLIGLVLFALVPFAEADNRAYGAAPVCEAGTRAGDCRVVLPATVVDKKTTTSGKSTKYYLYVVATGGSPGAAGNEHRVRLPGERPVFDRVHVGSRVTAVYWKDRVREIRAASGTQKAVLSPVHDGRLPGALALATLPVGLGLLRLRWWVRDRPAPKGAALSWKPVAGLVAGVLVAASSPVIMLLAVDDVGSGLRFAAGAAVVAVPLSALLGLWATRRVRRGVARIVPARPTERRVLSAVVHGDVPYSRPGYGCLVVGDGPLAATPDPTGHVALAPLPASLTVRRVREPLVGDPTYALGGRGEYTVVIECEDDGREVLVLAGRKDAPRVLGALLAADDQAAQPDPTG